MHVYYVVFLPSPHLWGRLLSSGCFWWGRGARGWSRRTHGSDRPAPDVSSSERRTGNRLQKRGERKLKHVAKKWDPSISQKKVYLSLFIISALLRSRKKCRQHYLLQSHLTFFLPPLPYNYKRVSKVFQTGLSTIFAFSKMTFINFLSSELLTRKHYVLYYVYN